MDIVWLVLDSVSFSATPFGDDGPETLPKLARLVESAGISFTRAYAPGPLSPSSHASFLSGKLPSVVGMHEAYPYFQTELPTIADALSRTHDTFLISSNPFLFNGLDERFDTREIIEYKDYLLFEEATDPQEFDSSTDSWFKNKYLKFLFSEGKPLRSFLNGANLLRHQRSESNTFIPKSIGSDSRNYQYANYINQWIGERLNRDEDAFILANYMDAHAPFDATEDALDEFAPGKSYADLPIGLTGGQFKTSDYSIEDYRELYYASIYDLDRKIAPFVRKLVDNGAMVIITADHGSGIMNNFTDIMGDDKLHIPLLLFAPGIKSGTVDHSVSLMQLPTTIGSLVDTFGNMFDHKSLLQADEDMISIAEHIHSPTDDSVSVEGTVDGNVQRDIAAIKGKSRVNSNNGDIEVVRDGSEVEARLVETVTDVSESEVRFGGGQHIEYSEETRQRLRDLGYV